MQPSLVKKAITGSAFVAGVMFVQPDGAEAAFGDQELKKGMNNQDVKELQDVLKAKGYFTYHTSTGYYGPITEDAVSQFQQAVGLKVSGIATTDTLQALGSRTAAKSEPSSSNVLQVGSRGQQVTNLQSKLKAEGYYSYNVDGIYGQITQNAVKEFQRDAGLSVTGKADAATISALSGSVSSSNSSSTSSDISIGMRGSAVTDLQTKLKAKGYYNYNVDGIFGQITKKAVQEFQKAAGLSQTGVADNNTLSVLSEKEAAKPATSGLTIGSRGSSVSNLQQILKNRGYYNYAVDGIFGSITQKAVKEFQSIVGLPATGIADDSTIDALKSRGGSSQQTETVLKVGSTGSAVTDLQNKLKKAGTFHVEATGYFGPVTEKAVKDFQKAKKLQVTGTATKETMDALDGLTEKVNSSPSTGEDHGDLLKKGSTGTLVKELQSKLKAIGLYSGPLDGDFGNGTEQAVRTFQSRNKLTVDGVVGPATWGKLKQSTGYEGNVNEDSTSGSSSSSDFSVMDLIADASVYIGVPYVWGGDTPTQGFDCSGFLVYVFNKQGISLPRTMAQMWNVTTPVSSPSVGDIVYFETYKPGASHGGIYIGNNKFIHAGSSTGVTISDLDNSYWAPRYLGAKRAH
ncbi:peptidoglycan-binding protein [Pseudalkalibacillus hwajinpoensis]|uniref:C40 family peptidase n=1 Tax=Guptibacillus hwajinpoensis TaxID=208199 RepID=UPI00325A5191